MMELHSTQAPHFSVRRIEEGLPAAASSDPARRRPASALSSDAAKGASEVHAEAVLRGGEGASDFQLPNFQIKA